MSKTDTIARMHRDGTVAEVLPDGTERPFPDTPMRPMTEEEFQPARKVPRAKTLPRALGLTQEEFARRYQIPIGTLPKARQSRTSTDSPSDPA